MDFGQNQFLEPLYTKSTSGHLGLLVLSSMDLASPEIELTLDHACTLTTVQELDSMVPGFAAELRKLKQIFCSKNRRRSHHRRVGPASSRGKSVTKKSNCDFRRFQKTGGVPHIFFLKI